MIFISCFLNILGYFLKYRHPSSVLFSKRQSTMQTENRQTSFTNWLSYCTSVKKPFSIWVSSKQLCIISSIFWRRYLRLYLIVGFNAVYRVKLIHFLFQQALSSEETIFITFALVLFRNVLHAPERQPRAQQNQLLCNLFSQKFDGFLLKLLACPQRVSE